MTPLPAEPAPRALAPPSGSALDLKDRDVHVVVVVRRDAAAVFHRDPARSRHTNVPDPLPVDDVHDPEPGGIRLGPGRNVVALLDGGDGWHHSPGAEHEVARPAQRMLAVIARTVAADGGERAEPAIDLVSHLAHARRDVVPDDRRLRLVLRQQAFDP